MADYQIGDNLYADLEGKYYRLNGGQKAYETSPYDAMTTRLNSLYDSQRKNQLDQLKAQRERAITGFNAQKKELAPQYQNQRNQADVVNAQNVSRLRELMASQGINASGENLTTQAGMASARQGALSEITTNENQVMGDIDRQIAEANDPSHEQAINNAIEGERSKALTDYYGQWQQDVYQRSLDWRNYQMQQQQLATSRAAAASRGGGGGGGGGRGGKSAKEEEVKGITKGQSYDDGIKFWQSQIANIKRDGPEAVEQKILSSPEQLEYLKSQGYNIQGLMDSLYTVASQGRFNSKLRYKNYKNLFEGM
jgi:hypothetical protein